MVANKKKRRPQPSRPIPPVFPTGAAERMANAKDRYFFDIEGMPPTACGPMGIRDRVTGAFEPLPTYTRSEVDDRIEQLNGRAPLASNKTVGRLRHRKSVKWSNRDLLSPTEWAERLYSHPPARAALKAYLAAERAPTVAEFQSLMSSVAPTGTIDRATLDKVSQQLRRKFGIKRPRDQ